MNFNQTRFLFVFLCLTVLFPFCSAGLALCAGAAFAVFFGNPFVDKTRKWTSNLLQISVVGLGAGMDLRVVGRVGAEGIVYTICSIAFAMTVGVLLGRILKATRDTALLITVGTAICGGSAIAAVAPTISAKSEDVSVSLATVFLLNAVALFIFPWIGHQVGLTETQFGLWSALAIHDTSSVVGAAMQYGTKALEIATTVKLARALWIVPLTIIISFFYKGASSAKNAKKPWFILGFIGVAAFVTWIPQLHETGNVVALLAKRSLVLTLFLIGSGLSKEALKKVGARPLILGISLWFIIGSSTLVAILMGFIR